MIWQVLTMVMTIINIAMLKHCIFNVLISIYLNTHRSINFLIFTGMTSPAPPNTRQVRLPLNLFIYLRHFERAAFKSGCSINKLLHCKPNTNTQCQKIPTSQNYSRYKLVRIDPLCVCLLVLYSEHIWFFGTFDFKFLTHCKSVWTHQCKQILFHFVVWRHPSEKNENERTGK